MPSESSSRTAPSKLYREVALFLRLMAHDAVTIRMAKLIVFCTLGIIVSSIVLNQLGGPSLSKLMDLTRDNSFPEAFMRGMSFSCALLFYLAYMQDGTRLPLFLSILYGFIWFDDSSRYHERAGLKFEILLDLQPAFGLRARDFGEMIAWFLVLPLVLGLAIWVWARRKPGDLGIAALVILSFVILVFFGMVVDMIGIMVPDQFSYVFGIMEDGGEILAVAFTAILAVGLERVGTEYRRICAHPPHDTG